MVSKLAISHHLYKLTSKSVDGLGGNHENDIEAPGMTGFL